MRWGPRAYPTALYTLPAPRARCEEQLALRPAPGTWPVRQLAGHMAGSRAYWLHDVPREGVGEELAMRGLSLVRLSAATGTTR